MSNGAELLKLIKNIVAETVKASKPMMIVRGTVTSVDPLVIRLSEKLTLTKEFLLFGRNVKKEKLEINNKLLLLRQQGGQKYYVIDILEEANIDVT